ncbi:MAG: NUDIX hydrolase [Gammaproteobacteria bacterium]|nr:NUDIX hydrolase [Gammaproteobacteria bacterium]
MDTIWKPHVVTATVVRRDDRYLCVEEEIDGARVFNQPAGHLDPGETLPEAAIRETLEETAWHVRIDALTGVYLMETEIPGKTFLRFCFAASALEHDASRSLDKEIVAAHWLTRAELEACRERHRSPLVLRAIDDYEAGLRYPLELLKASLRG